MMNEPLFKLKSRVRVKKYGVIKGRIDRIEKEYDEINDRYIYFYYVCVCGNGILIYREEELELLTNNERRSVM